MLIRAFAVIIAALAVASCSNEEGGIVPIDGLIELSDAFTGDFSLIDKTGEARTDEDFEGKIMLVYFGFTYCPDVCPGDVGVMSATLNALGDDADEVAPVFITVDPERDTPSTLRDYFTFDERIVALTGSLEASEKAKAGFKQYAKKELLPDSALEYTINHARFFYITDRSGQPILALTGGVGPETLATVIRRQITQ